ncbi:MAG: hypothetical protein WCH65_07515 [bacterium]
MLHERTIQVVVHEPILQASPRFPPWQVVPGFFWYDQFVHIRSLTVQVGVYDPPPPQPPQPPPQAYTQAVPFRVYELLHEGVVVSVPVNETPHARQIKF